MSISRNQAPMYKHIVGFCLHLDFHCHIPEAKASHMTKPGLVWVVSKQGYKYWECWCIRVPDSYPQLQPTATNSDVPLIWLSEGSITKKLESLHYLCSEVITEISLYKKKEK